jgi:hypothetical protein
MHDVRLLALQPVGDLGAMFPGHLRCCTCTITPRLGGNWLTACNNVRHVWAVSSLPHAQTCVQHISRMFKPTTSSQCVRNVVHRCA